MKENLQLFDIATRSQIYIEGVKTYYKRDFNSTLKEVSDSIRSLVSKVKYKTLDGLTKSELNKLLVSLRLSQTRIYSAYTEKLIKQLEEFMTVNAEVKRRAYVYARFKMELPPEAPNPEIPTEAEAIRFINEDESNYSFVGLFGIAAATTNARMWSVVRNEPIGANGILPETFVKNFGIMTAAGVENLIRKAWVNGWTVEETLSEIIGEADRKQGTPSQIDRIRSQGAAVIDTTLQHVAGVSDAAVASSLFFSYIWLSVIDTRTSDICRSRNRKVYEWGEGPLPPAHVNCRSHVAPIVGNDDESRENFYTWLKSQPALIQNDVLGELAEDFRLGKIKQEDLPKFNASKPLTLKEYRLKIANILLSRGL